MPLHGRLDNTDTSIDDGTIQNKELTSATVSLGGVAVSLGGTVTEPAFNLTNSFNFPAGSLSGSTLASGVTASSLTSLGTLISLDVTGNLSVGSGTTIFSNGTATFGGSVTASSFIGSLTGTATNADDADTVDGVQASQFLRNDQTSTVLSGNILQFQTATGNVRGTLQATETDNAHFIIATSGGEDISFRDGSNVNMTIRGDGVLLQGTTNTIWHAGNDGTGSGLDADLLDGQEGSYYQNASNLNAGTVNTARLPNTYSKAAGITIEATGATNDVALNAGDNIFLNSGQSEDASIYFRGNSAADSYRFAKSGQTAIEGFLSFESLTADRTFTFPDTTGTIALTSSTVANASAADTLDVSTSGSNATYKVPFLNYGGNAPGTFSFLHDSVSSQFTYNPSTNTLTVGTFSGTASRANDINVTQDVGSNTRYIPFVANVGYQAPLFDSSLTYNPGTNQMGLGRLQLLQTGSSSSSQLLLNGGTMNRIYFNSQGVALPDVVTRTAGTKIVLYPAIGNTSLDYAMGVGTNVFWFSLPEADTLHEFQWYGAFNTLRRQLMTLGYDEFNVFMNDSGISRGRIRVYNDGNNSGGEFIGGDGSGGTSGIIRVGSGRGSSGNFSSNNGFNIVCSQNSGETLIGVNDGIFDVFGAINRGGLEVEVGGVTRWGVASGSGTMCTMKRYESGKIFSFIEGSLERGSISVDFSANTTSFNTTSDYRIKENIVPVTNALEKVNQLRPVNFNFIGKEQRLDGFIAHEVQDILPYAVTGEKDATEMKTVFDDPDNTEENDGTYEKEQARENAPKHEEEVPVYQQLDNSKLVSLLTAAIQELSAKNDALEARIAQLESQ